MPPKKRETDVRVQVPRSTQVISEDHEFALVSVVIFCKEVDNFKQQARGHGFQVRDFTFEPEQSEAQKENLEATKAEAANKKQLLEQWCVTSYAEARHSSPAEK